MRNPTPLDTNPAKVAEYAQQLHQDAKNAEVRGVISFEDRGDSVTVVEVGSCNPLSARMLMGLARFVLRELLGH